MKRVEIFALAALVLIGAAACQSDTAEPAASVQFKADSPLCGGGKFSLQFSIDNQVVGSDSLSNGKSSKAFTTTPGAHSLHAQLLTSAAFVWDTTVTLADKQAFVDLIPIYCS